MLLLLSSIPTSACTDIFKKDFVDPKNAPVTFEMTGDAPAGVEVTSSSSWDYAKSGSAIDTTVSATWSHPSGFTLEKLEFTPADKATLTTETSLSGLAKGLKLEFKGNDADKGDLSFTYKLPQATLTGEMDFMNFKKFNIAAATGMDQITAGFKCDIAKSDKGMSTTTAASASYAMGNIFAGLEATSNFSKYGILASFAVDKTMTAALRADIGPKAPSVQVGGVYKCNSATTMKGKINVMSRMLDLSVKHAMDKKFNVTASAQIADFSPKGIVFGLKATMG